MGLIVHFRKAIWQQDSLGVFVFDRGLANGVEKRMRNLFRSQMMWGVRYARCLSSLS